MIRYIRKAHLFLGCFFAPLLIFYVSTGWYQTVNPDRRKGANDTENWIGHLTRVHVEQYYPTQSAASYSTRLFTVLVVVMSIALLATVVLGIVLAFRLNRVKWPVWLSLLGGCVVPMVILWLGQKR